MREKIERLRTWLQSLTQQQRVLVLLLFICISYFVWSGIWGGYYGPERDAAVQQKKSMEDKIKDITSTQAKLKALRTNPDILAMKKKLNDLRDQLQKVSRQLVSAKQMLDQLNAMFAKQTDVKFFQVQNLGVTPFSLEAPGQEPDKKGEANTPAVKKPASFYTHTFVISFEANYASTESYIEQLQKLPGQLYFDNIEYNVQKYPIANVVIKVHTISLDEALINA